MPVRITEEGPKIPKPKDVRSTDKFVGLSERSLLTHAVPNIRAEAYDFYCPSVKDVQKLICNNCDIMFTSAAAVKRHQRGGGCEDVIDEMDNITDEDEDEALLNCSNC